MLHLLPEEQKKKVLKEYRRRLATTIAVSGWVVASIGIVSLAPSYIVSKYRQVEIEHAAKTVKQSVDSLNADELSQKLTELAVKARLLKPISNSIVPTEIYSRIKKIGAGDVSISNFGYIHTGEADSVDVSGVAKNRTSLTRFIDTLKKDKVFSGVNFPYNSLSKQTNLDFNLHLSIKETELIKERDIKPQPK